MAKYVKSPKHKTLTLAIGGGDKTIFDGDILEGPQWKKFADLGFLVELKENEAPAPTPPPAPAKLDKAPEPTKVESEPEIAAELPVDMPNDEGTTTKSPGYKLRTGKRSSKKTSSHE